MKNRNSKTNSQNSLVTCGDDSLTTCGGDTCGVEVSDWFERRAAMIARDDSHDSLEAFGFDRPKPKPRSYEVTIQGVGLKPLVEAYEATSPGLAKLAALDKYGRWIKVCEVKEMKPKAKQQNQQPRHLRCRQQKQLQRLRR